MHKLLARQLKKSRIKVDEVDTKCAKLLDMVSAMYFDVDEEMLAMQHTMKKLDEDMQQVYAKMRGRISAVAETMPDMIVLINSQAVSIELFSIGEQKLFSREEIASPYVNIHELFKQKYQVGIVSQMVQEALQTKTLQVRELEIAEYIIDISIMATGLVEKNERTLILSVRDVTLQRKAQRNIEYIAQHDGLTTLYNRRFFNLTLERLQKEISEDTFIALLYLDLNKFKEINDTLGHHAGDIVLKEASKRLQLLKEEEDLLFRLGGDEFVYICFGRANRKDVESFSTKISEKFKEPFLIEGNNYSLSTSIGIAIYPEDSTNFDDLVRFADEAMFFSKTHPDRAYTFFKPEMIEVQEQSQKMQDKIQSALYEEKFTLHFQPQVSLDTENIVGVEALIRWYDDEFGYVPPDQFIAVAEESTAILAIDVWVVRHVCEAIVRWQCENLPPVKVSVNLSRAGLGSRENMKKLITIIQESGIDPGRLEFEITESALLENAQSSLENLALLKELGCSIAIDDFGTGYSSLSNMHRFAFDKIKIDKSFIDKILTDKTDLAIVTSTISLARNLETVVVAEGIEKKEQAILLKSLGCDQIQGFYYYKPCDEKRLWKLDRNCFQTADTEVQLSEVHEAVCCI